ncbi:MAG: Gfo/Idh/MocA family oxidoreductase [Elusimicrobia bacterium]|nr:Gfo/Idh/MocA family oxidoreductase [Elusimicrobiota bacterium]
MNQSNPINVSIIGAGSTYGIFLVKWALQLKHHPETNRDKIPVPPIGTISYSNTTERNKDLVRDVLLNDLSRMPSFAKIPSETILKDVHGYTNWREMILKESPTMVVICSPIPTHVAYLRELLTDFKVKNILCEPPLGHSHEIESLQKIVQLACERNVKIGVNQQYRILYEELKDIPLNPNSKQGGSFGNLLKEVDGLKITFITHGTRLWRKMQAVGEQEILEDLGPHVYELIPQSLRNKKLSIQEVKKEGDNLFLNFVEYDLLFGEAPVRITLGYHRKLKNLKLILTKDKKDYEFYISGATNPETGEYTRWIEGKNYAYYFKHFLDTDLVKTSFLASLAGTPIVPIEDGIKSLEFIHTLYSH